MAHSNQTFELVKMAEGQSEIQMLIESLRARASEFQKSPQPPSGADVADIIEDVARAFANVDAELKSLRRK